MEYCSKQRERDSIRRIEREGGKRRKIRETESCLFRRSEGVKRNRRQWRPASLGKGEIENGGACLLKGQGTYRRGQKIITLYTYNISCFLRMSCIYTF